MRRATRLSSSLLAAIFVLGVVLAPAAAASNNVVVKLDTLRWQWPQQFDVIHYKRDKLGLGDQVIETEVSCPPPSGERTNTANQGPLEWCNFTTGPIPVLAADDDYSVIIPCQTLEAVSPLGFVQRVRPTYIDVTNNFIGPMELEGIGPRRQCGPTQTPFIKFGGELTKNGDSYILKIYFDDSQVPSAQEEQVAVDVAAAKMRDAEELSKTGSCEQKTLGDGDVFEGTEGPDCVKIDIAPESSAVIKTRGGDDSILVDVPDGSSVDISAGASNDTVLVTGEGDATVRGGHGDDIILADNGGDTITGGPGTDVAVGAGGTDELSPSVEFAAQGYAPGLDYGSTKTG